MAKSRTLPLVAICGRPTWASPPCLSNHRKQRAIIHAKKASRGPRYGVAEHNGCVFRVVDTGGIVEIHRSDREEDAAAVRVALNEPR